MKNRFLTLLLVLPALAAAQVTEFVGRQKDFLESPVRLLENGNIIPAAAVIAATASLLAVDHPAESLFARTPAFRGFDNVFSSRATEIGILAAPAALFATGLFRGDPKMQQTSFLAAESIGDAEVVAFALKNMVRRESPGGMSTGSFPSGHAITAFAAATVIAHRYSNHKWAPFVAYGLAGAIGFSRVTSSAHYVSDVFAGAALGYAIGRFTDAQGIIPGAGH